LFYRDICFNVAQDLKHMLNQKIQTCITVTRTKSYDTSV